MVVWHLLYLTKLRFYMFVKPREECRYPMKQIWLIFNSAGAEETQITKIILLKILISKNLH